MGSYTKAGRGIFAWNGSELAGRLAAATGNVLRQIAAWGRLARERAELYRLSDRDLQDMGISRATALGEARKPFWRK
jgi:uncharacterized protein YjiS (DUF1127 family)